MYVDSISAPARGALPGDEAGTCHTAAQLARHNALGSLCDPVGCCLRMCVQFSVVCAHTFRCASVRM